MSLAASPASTSSGGGGLTPAVFLAGIAALCAALLGFPASDAALCGSFHHQVGMKSDSSFFMTPWDADKPLGSLRDHLAANSGTVGFPRTSVLTAGISDHVESLTLQVAWYTDGAYQRDTVDFIPDGIIVRTSFTEDALIEVPAWTCNPEPGRSQRSADTLWFSIT